jgi:flagellar biosynthesis protein FlhA
MKAAIEAVPTENPAIVCTALIRPHVRMLVERTRPATPVLAQQEIYSKSRVRSLGTI